MGYTTEFNGCFELDKPLTPEDKDFLIGLATTRRMKRAGLDPKYGIDGEFYMEDREFFGQHDHPSIVDYNSPPSTQPGLWCQWIPISDTEIAWDGGEKFYNYVQWLEYILENILIPRGYTLNGNVQWRGEDWDDTGTIVVENNSVITYSNH